MATFLEASPPPVSRAELPTDRRMRPTGSPHERKIGNNWSYGSLNF
jgi:hypothetical protein